MKSSSAVSENLLSVMCDEFVFRANYQVLVLSLWRHFYRVIAPLDLSISTSADDTRQVKTHQLCSAASSAYAKLREQEFTDWRADMCQSPAPPLNRLLF